MQFRVKVPEGVKGHEIVTVNAGGAQFCVRVPAGVARGDSFFFTLTPQEIKNASKGVMETTLVEGTKEFVSVPLMSHDFYDFAMALFLGFLIGGTIVTGFVAGVLYVT